MDSSTKDKLKGSLDEANEPSTPFAPQSGGATTHETLRPGSGMPEPRTQFESSRTQTASPIENLATAAGDKATEYRGKAEKVLNDAHERMHSFHEESERYVRENPIRAIVSVLGIGFLLGLIFRRR